MERNYKNELTLSICKEIRSKGMEIEYELYHKIIKMIYKNKGSQAENNIRKNSSEKEIEKGKMSRRNFKKNDKERFREKRRQNNNKYYNKYEDEGKYKNSK